MGENYLDENLNIFLSEILDQAVNGILIIDPKKDNNPIIYANKSFYKMFDYKEDEVIGKNYRFLQTNQKKQKSIDEIRKAIKEEKSITTIVKNQKKNGVIIHCELTISPIFDENNKLQFFLGIQKDVTREVEITNKMNIAQRLANIGTWEYDIANNNLFWSDQIYKIFEINKSKFEPSYEYFLNAIHPEDKEMVNNAYLNSLETKKPYAIQHRLKMKDGRIKYVEEKCDNYFDKNGNPYRSVGTVQDISQIKEIEYELKRTISLFESYKIAMDKSSIVSKSDLEGKITYVNDNLCKISGYTKEELIGKPHSIIRHPDNPKSIFEDLWSTIKSKKVWKKTLKNITKNGDYYWVDITIVPILDDKNNINEYIGIRHDVTKTIEQQKKLDTIVNTDVLTNLGNRYKLINDINKSTNPALAIINIDRFSEINDFYGYVIGDKILKKFAKKLNDIKNSNNCNIYRLHSDEFVIFYENINSDLFLQKIEFINTQLKKENFYIDNEDFINLHFTIAISFEEKSRILNTATMTIKIAKQHNKDILVYKDEISLDKEYENNIKWTKLIKDAIEKDNILPVYQPIINNKTLKDEKYEALVRMKKEEKLISPYFFLEISKKTKFYNQITKIMIEKTIEKFKDLEFNFSINLTIEDILNAEIKEFIYKILSDSQIGKRIVFEIVESESIENFAIVLEFIKKVKSFGCKIAIDDFGTGYSNFEYLLKLKADFIKIDGSLIKNIDKDILSEKVCKNIVNFAKDLGMKTIAEFVENESILKKVQELGIDYSQGYLFSAPFESLKNINLKKV